MVADFDLCSVPLYAKEAHSAALLPNTPPDPENIYMWTVEMNEKGISGDDLQFLVDVLNPRPDVRLNSAEIMMSGYLKTPR